MFSGVARIFQPFSKSSVSTSSFLHSESDLLEKLESLASIITNHDITSMRLVANPDTFSIENAKRALMSASLYDINVDLAIVNKIVPSLSSDAYYADMAVFQKNKLEEARANFYPLPIREIKLHNNELRGLEMLENNGEAIFGNEDASKIFHRGKTFSFIRETHLYE